MFQSENGTSDIDLNKFYSDENCGRLHMPTTFFWGSGFIRNIPNLVNGRSVEVFIDGIVAEQMDLSWIDELNISNLHRTYGTPWVEDVEEYIEKNPQNPECALVIGGGSTADFAKGVIARRAYGEISELGVGKRSGAQVAKSALPEIVGVPTTIGSGAESSRYFVLYEKATKAKVHGKSWALVASTVVVDPDLLRNLPPQVAISSAFDSFVHYWESLICKHESTFATRMFSKHGIAEVIINLKRVLQDSSDLEAWTNLGLNASLAGTAISNTRTGNIHEAAGALLERVNLSHGETLMVFAQSAYDQYMTQTSTLLDNTVQQSGLVDFQSALNWWNELFEKYGMINKISRELNLILDLDEARQHIFKRVSNDKVWVNKESPIGYGDALIRDLIDKGFSKFLTDLVVS
ncbi:MAG: iron-containing alcohol dehydrogenase [Actinomycetes bacterium]